MEKHTSHVTETISPIIFYIQTDLSQKSRYWIVNKLPYKEIETASYVTWTRNLTCISIFDIYEISILPKFCGHSMFTREGYISSSPLSPLPSKKHLQQNQTKSA